MHMVLWNLIIVKWLHIAIQGDLFFDNSFDNKNVKDSVP